MNIAPTEDITDIANSSPGSFFYNKNRKVLLVSCGDNKYVHIASIKPEGGKALDIPSFINGIRGIKSGVFDER